MPQTHATAPFTQEKIRFAKASLGFNVRSSVFNACFPHYKEVHQRLVLRAAQHTATAKAAGSNDTRSAAALPAPVRRPEDTTDKLIIATIVVLLAFAMSYLYK